MSAKTRNGRLGCFGALLVSVLLLGLGGASRAQAAEGPPGAPLEASFSMLPDTIAAGAPAGYSLNLSLPGNAGPEGSEKTSVERMSVALAPGTVISPAIGDGQGTCSNAQFALDSPAPGACPTEAQIGTASMETPAAAEPLQGQVFLGEPSCNPCTPADAQSGRMVRVFVQISRADEPAAAFKLEGIAEINQQTDQITVSFEQIPQTPFSDLKLSLNGGEHALLANPRTCGPESANVELTPSSASSTPDFLADEFAIDQNCFAPQFHPTPATQTGNDRAGGYDPLTLAFARTDSDEYLSAIQSTLAEGLLGTISSVSPCGEAQAAQGSCGAGSLIGHAAVQLGPGADPSLVEGGQIFLTGPYRGAPFGLAIVVPARVGPYTLAGTDGAGEIVIRAAVNVNSRTAALTITSDPFPSALDGVPLQLRLLDLVFDRPDFMFNPTSCAPLQITSTLSSVENATATVASPFQASDCTAFTFAPTFAVSTPAKTSKINGTSLYVKIVDPHTDAVAEKVRIELPKQLTARLSTLREACPAATFESNPAACPPGSLVGVARSSMPLMSSIFTGPAYFVSYGGAKFPELVIVLQAEGVTVDLHGETFINDAGVTSSTFASIPDVPVNYFEMILPAGPYSALAANGNLCRGRLTMPNEFAGYNGAVLKRSTQIAVTGCPRAKQKRPRARRRHRLHRASHGHGHARRGQATTSRAKALALEATTPPLASTGPANGVQPTSATLTGLVETSGPQTSYGVQTGTEAGDYGPDIVVGRQVGTSTQTIALALNELQTGTTYHYRVYATNPAGTSYGTDVAFTTPTYPDPLTQPSTPAPLATPAVNFPSAAPVAVGEAKPRPHRKEKPRPHRKAKPRPHRKAKPGKKAKPKRSKTKQ